MVDADYAVASVDVDGDGNSNINSNINSNSNSNGNGNGVALPPMDPESYKFPDHRLKKVMSDPAKTPLLLVACGSFSPTTYLHLRMFEMAADYIKFSTDFELIGGYLSPVSDAYKKAGLASAFHRYVLISFSFFNLPPLLDLRITLTKLLG